MFANNICHGWNNRT